MIRRNPPREPRGPNLADSISPPAREPGAPHGATRRQLKERCEQGARWFYLVAALSFITSLVSFYGIEWDSMVSLGVARAVDPLAFSLAYEFGWPVRIVAVAADAAVAAVVATVGYFASMRHILVFLAGMVAYALDGVVFVFAGEWPAVAFHLLALFIMYTGYRACVQLAALDREDDSSSSSSHGATGTQTTP